MKTTLLLLITLALSIHAANSAELLNCKSLNFPEIKDPIQKIEIDQEDDYRQLFNYSPYESVKFIGKKKSKKGKKNIYSYTIQNAKLTAPDAAKIEKKITYDAIFYKVKSKEKRPLVIVHPSIKGVTFIEKNIAKSLAKAGFNTLISVVDRDKEIHKRPIHALNVSIMRSTSAIRMWIDYFEKQDFIDASKIVAFGTSDGGNRTSIAIQIEDRIKATVLYVSGGNFPKMFVNSEQKIIKAYRKYKLEKEYSQSKKKFRKSLSEQLMFDPLFLAHTMDPDKISMFIALNDTSVPTINQVELWRAFGKPRAFCKDVRHIAGAINSYYRETEIIDFFKSKLGMK